MQPSALFLFAHQDDEFGVFQKIIDELQQGRRVFCAFLTDGVFAGQSSMRRNNESLAVLTKLGVQEGDIFFVGYTLSIPDGGLPDNLAIASEWLNAWLARYPLVGAIYLPAWEGGHHDHDALHAIGVIAAEQFNLITIVRQFPLYNGYKCRGLMFRVLLPLPMNGDLEVVNLPWVNRIRFLRFCLNYPTQLTSWIGLFPFVFLHYIFYGTQVLQPVSKARLRQPPHVGPLYYERRKFYTWKKIAHNLSTWIEQNQKSN